ncbi:unnamed protein product [Ixodes persulcatus]
MLFIGRVLTGTNCRSVGSLFRNARKKEQEEESKRVEREKAQKESEERAIEKAKIDLELARANGKPSSVGQQGWKMKNLLQPYRVGEDIGLFLVNFERACERASFSGVVASAPLDVVAV